LLFALRNSAPFLKATQRSRNALHLLWDSPRPSGWWQLRLLLAQEQLLSLETSELGQEPQSLALALEILEWLLEVLTLVTLQHKM
jgi:hypothetical protein